jgi:hypothetical protein
MKRLPELYNKKIDIIKKVILTRSGFLSEFGMNNIRIDLIDAIYRTENNQLKFSELIFEVALSDIDCDDCDFELRSILRTLEEYQDRLYEASSIMIDEDLKVKNGTCLRGLLNFQIEYANSTINKVVFGVFFDVGRGF